MITDNDERTFTKTKYLQEFKDSINIAFTTLLHEKRQFVEYDYGMNRIQKKPVINRFDEIIKEHGGFELDGRTLKHAHGIGNNSEYDIVDKDLIKVGAFHYNSDMFGGVYVYVKVNGETVKRIFISPTRARLELDNTEAIL